MKGFIRNFKPLEILTDEQIEVIHRAALDVLEETGIRFEHERGLDALEKNGCQVDRDNMRVRIPADLVEECLRKCPSSFHVKARDPKNDLRLGGNTLYFEASCGMRTVDLDSWEVRSATKSETVDGLKVLDVLDNVHLLSPYCPYYGFEGVPEVMKVPEMVAAKMRHTTKVQMTGSVKDSEIFNIKMAKAVGCDILGLVNASPPLTFYKDAVEAIFRYAEAGSPFHVSSGAGMGSTGPTTVVGSTITNNAEIIAGLVLAQLIKPGTRVWAGNFVTATDMKTGAPAFGAIANSLHQVIFNQIWRKYGVPTWTGAPAFSNSKKVDFQCGYEKGITAILAAVSGVSVIIMHGGIYGELAFHPVQAIVDDDIAGMVGRFIEGVEVTDETLATELIEQVGPIPGYYLNKAHTRKWWRNENFVPNVADRLTYPEWIEKGKKSALEYAKERMEQILAKHEPKSLSKDQDKEINEILKEARMYYKQKGLI